MKLSYQIVTAFPRTLTLNFGTSLFTDQKPFVACPHPVVPPPPRSGMDPGGVGLSSVSALYAGRPILTFPNMGFMPQSGGCSAWFCSP